MQDLDGVIDRLKAARSGDQDALVAERIALIDHHLGIIGPGQMRDHLLQLKARLRDPAGRQQFITELAEQHGQALAVLEQIRDQEAGVS